MLKRVLHTANQVVTHAETHTGTRELTIENTVNDNVDMLTVTGDSWQLAQEEIKDEEGNVTQPAMPSTEYPSEIISVNGEMISTNDRLDGRDKLRGNSIILPTLRSLPDGTKDVLYVDRKNQRAWVERKIGETVLDGSETWSVYADTKGVIEYRTIKMGVKVSWDFPLHCSHCKSTKGYNIYVQYIVDDMVFGIPGINQLVFGSKSKTGIFESIDTFKAFLSEHPVTVQYGLIDPIIEELPYSDYLLKTAQYQTNIRMTGLNENLQPEITAQCKILGR